MVEDKRKILQQYLQDLSLIPAIKESVQFREFLEIHKHYNEHSDEAWNDDDQIDQREDNVNSMPAGNVEINQLSEVFIENNLKKPYPTV